MELSKFKDELRARVTDFAVTHHLIGMSESKTNAAKKKQAEEAYQRLENWIIGNRLGSEEVVDEGFSVVESSMISDDQQVMDF